MLHVVLCGPAGRAPDRVVGPFRTADEANQWIGGQVGQPGRYHVPMAITKPHGHVGCGQARTSGPAAPHTSVEPSQADQDDAGKGRTYLADIQITQRPPTPFDLPQGRVHIATQRWELEPWTGAPDPPDLQRMWGRKPKFSVNGRRSCAELAVVERMRQDGWDGVWVSAFAGSWLRTEWFPAPGYRTLAEVGAPAWAVQIFERLRSANDGKLSGFFDVFAWTEPEEVRFLEVKVARDRIQPTQRRFLERALRLHDQGQFMIIEVPG